MKAAELADKYIARDGGPPRSAPPHAPAEQRLNDISVACFLDYEGPKSLWGGHTEENAFEAFCRLIGIRDIEAFRQVIKG